MPIICFTVHGIGPQDTDFAETLQRGVQGKLDLKVSKAVIFKPIHWASIGDAEQKTLSRRIYPQLYGNHSSFRRLVQTWQNLGRIRELSLTLIGDIFSYLGRFEEDIKRSVFIQIRDTLTPYLESRESLSLIVVGHSLGSVVVHDLLSGLVRYGYPGMENLMRRTTIVTLGSPIALFSLVRDYTALSLHSIPNEPLLGATFHIDGNVHDLSAACELKEDKHGPIVLQPAADQGAFWKVSKSLSLGSELLVTSDLQLILDLLAARPDEIALGNSRFDEFLANIWPSKPEEIK